MVEHREALQELYAQHKVLELQLFEEQPGIHGGLEREIEEILQSELMGRRCELILSKRKEGMSTNNSGKQSRS